MSNPTASQILSQPSCTETSSSQSLATELDMQNTVQTTDKQSISTDDCFELLTDDKAMVTIKDTEKTDKQLTSTDDCSKLHTDDEGIPAVQDIQKAEQTTDLHLTSTLDYSILQTDEQTATTVQDTQRTVPTTDKHLMFTSDCPELLPVEQAIMTVQTTSTSDSMELPTDKQSMTTVQDTQKTVQITDKHLTSIIDCSKLHTDGEAISTVQDTPKTVQVTDLQLTHNSDLSKQDNDKQALETMKDAPKSLETTETSISDCAELPSDQVNHPSDNVEAGPGACGVFELGLMEENSNNSPEKQSQPDSNRGEAHSVEENPHMAEESKEHQPAQNESEPLKDWQELVKSKSQFREQVARLVLPFIVQERRQRMQGYSTRWTPLEKDKGLNRQHSSNVDTQDEDAMRYYERIQRQRSQEEKRKQFGSWAQPQCIKDSVKRVGEMPLEDEPLPEGYSVVLEGPPDYLKPGSESSDPSGTEGKTKKETGDPPDKEPSKTENEVKDEQDNLKPGSENSDKPGAEGRAKEGTGDQQEKQPSKAENEGLSDGIYVSIPSYVKKTSIFDTHFVFEVKLTAGADTWSTYRRYSQFRDLHNDLRFEYPKCDFGEVPPTRFFSNRPRIVAERRIHLEHYLRRVLQVLQSTPESRLYVVYRDGYSKATLSLVHPFFREEALGK